MEAGCGPNKKLNAEIMTTVVLTSDMDVDLVVVAGRVAHHVQNLQAGVIRLAKTMHSCQHSMSSSSL